MHNIHIAIIVLFKYKSLTAQKLIIFLNFIFDIYVDDSTEIGFIRNSTRQFLLQALLKSLDQPAPNLAHLLLGFDIRKSVSKTLLQDPGIMCKTMEVI